MRAKMGRPLKEYSEAEKNEVKKAYKNSHNEKERNRLLCLKLRVVKGMSAEQIASIVDYTIGTINHIISKYNRYGIESIKAKKQTGHNRNMSVEEEVQFLLPFREKAIAGEILEVSDIIKAYSEALNGKKVSKSTVYDLLARHNWRKVMPRSRHPEKASDEEISAFKKNWKPV